MRMKWMLAGVMGVAVAAHAGAPKYQYVIHGNNGQELGTVSVSKAKKGGVHVKVELHDVPFGPHGAHFHQTPVCTAPDFKSAGGHFNPDGKQHGYQNPLGHHAGDTPENINVGEDHRGEASFDIPELSMNPAAPNSVFGTSFVLHEHADDMHTDPSGNSGNRIGCAVVQQ